MAGDEIRKAGSEGRTDCPSRRTSCQQTPVPARLHAEGVAACFVHPTRPRRMKISGFHPTKSVVPESQEARTGDHGPQGGTTGPSATSRPWAEGTTGHSGEGPGRLPLAWWPKIRHSSMDDMLTSSLKYHPALHARKKMICNSPPQKTWEID